MKDAHVPTNEDNTTAPPEKKSKLESAVRIKEELLIYVVSVYHSQSEQVWLCRGRYVLTILEKEMILQGEQLNDRIINVAQQLIH